MAIITGATTDYANPLASTGINGTVGANPYNSPNQAIANSYNNAAANVLGNPATPTTSSPNTPIGTYGYQNSPNLFGPGNPIGIPSSSMVNVNSGWTDPVTGLSSTQLGNGINVNSGWNASQPIPISAFASLGATTPTNTNTGTPAAPAGGTGSSAPGGAAFVPNAGNTGPGYSGAPGPGTPASGMAGYNVPDNQVPAGYYNQNLANVIGGQGTTVAPTFSTYLAQQNAAMNSPFMTPAAIANQTAQFAAGAPPGLPDGYYSWTPAAQYAWNYAQTNPNAPEVEAAGSVQNFINQYQGQQYAYQNVDPNAAGTVAATGFGSGQPQTGQQGANIQAAIQNVLAKDGTNGYFNPNNPTGMAGGGGGTINTPTSSGTNTNQTTTNPITNGLTSTQIQQLTSYLQGLNQTGVTTTPLGYTQYTGQPQSASSAGGLSSQDIIALLSILGGNNNNTPTQTSYAQL